MSYLQQSDMLEAWWGYQTCPLGSLGRHYRLQGPLLTQGFHVLWGGPQTDSSVSGAFVTWTKAQGCGRGFVANGLSVGQGLQD